MDHGPEHHDVESDDARRDAAVDRTYAVYDEQPLDEPDAWGDLASFRDAAGAS